jgi:CDP-diacylglycerol---serine O-phosphatidyltransferase
MVASEEPNGSGQESGPGGRLGVLGQRRWPGRSRPPLKRGIYLLPSLFTLGNMFCGYLTIMYSIRGEFETAAPYIGLAVVLDMLDGRIARMTGTASAFGLEFDSLADVISFGVAPAVMAFLWGLQPLERLGWAAAFIYMTAAAVRLARFNIQTSTVDKRYFVGMPSPAAAAIPAATVYFYPQGFTDARLALIALAVMLTPAVLMVSTIRFNSFKTIDMQQRRSYKLLVLLALVIAVIQLHPRSVLIGLAYAYLGSALLAALWRLVRPRGAKPEPTA